YGFRYVKLTEWSGDIDLNDFEGWEIHSDMDEIGKIKTSDELVNQLISNARWGMKDNFLDVPTDCPQRDERYGWTGDAQIFSGTACFTMDTSAFYTKYCHDLYMEQKKLGGSVPDVVPVAHVVGDASTIWADAATIIPWNVYLHSGDKGILRRQYDSMKAWVDYMKREDDKYGAKRLWQTGTHYADWVALDGNYPGGVYGGTDQHYIASANYYNSSCIVAKAARILGKSEDAGFYEKLAGEIREAFLKEYFTATGKLAVDTMTGYVYALYFNLIPEGATERVKEGLMNKLRKSRYHLQTGFAGTPYLCRVLSDNGMNDMAYHLLMEKGYPGWLYAVLMGATTIWERWNSIMPDGHISGTEMNSLNHYSYGSIVEWMYRDMLGIRPDEEGAGFKRFTIAPLPNYRISFAAAELNSAAGLIKSAWTLEKGKLNFEFSVPFDSQARIVLPDAKLSDLEEAGKSEGISDMRQEGNNVAFTAQAGDYKFSYVPTAPYRRIYSLDTPFKELMENEKTKKILDEEYFTYVNHIPFEDELYTMEEMMNGPFTCVPFELRDKIDGLLREVE
ncbi:MAG: alfa-L-rhamnosidase RamA, partial [Lachnospiraceae bacterium]|nr:alfa-L-rhamnosidase RamA [Lachnospiraceae bacterium]